MNGTLNVVVHEWAPNLNTSFKNSSFKIIDSSIMLHNHYLETSLYVFLLPKETGGHVCCHHNQWQHHPVRHLGPCSCKSSGGPANSMLSALPVL
jgi:hypothetical protein